MTPLGAAALAIVVAAAARTWLPRVSTRPRAGYTWWALPVAALLGGGAAAVVGDPSGGIAGAAGRSGSAAGVLLTLVLAAVAGAAALLAVVDVAEHRLPNSVIGLALAVWCVGAVALAILDGRWGPLGRSAVGAAALSAVFLALALLTHGSLGFGDVKLSVLLGAVLAWFGWPVLLVGVVIGVMLHGVLALGVLAVTRNLKSDVPMGPALIAGTVAVLAWGVLAGV